MVAALVVLAATPAMADVTIPGNDETGTRDCGGGVATVTGNRNRLSFRNCSKLAVNGNGNVLDAGPVEAVSLLGNGNRVTWAPGPGGRRARVSDLGSDNQVSQRVGGGAETGRRGRREGAEVQVDEGGATVSSGGTTVKVEKGGVTLSGPEGKVEVDSGGVSAGGSRRTRRGGDLVVDEAQVTLTHDCGGGNAIVNTGDNVLTLRNCREVTINGGSNDVTVTGAETIRVPGADNTVTWRPGRDGRRPRIVNSGTGNTITGQ
jgi:hypothetical protein